MKQTCSLLAVLALSLSVIGLQALAQDSYPMSPIRLVVGSPPGGGSTDVFARLLAQKLSIQLGVNVFVENKPGANAHVANEFVARSAPNGYTLLFNTSGVILGPALGQKLNYNLFTDLTPIALVSTVPYVLMVHPSIAANTVGEFIAYLKANPDKLAYGSAGTGNFTHLGVLMFLEANGLSALHVPYKGIALALPDVLAGRLQFAMSSTVSAAPLVKSNRLKGLAITSLKRSDILPDVPTFDETVMPGFEVGGWYGVMAAAKTPPAIVRKLNSEIVRALQDPDMQSRFAREGAELFGPITPERYGTFLRSELARWTKLIEKANIRAE